MAEQGLNKVYKLIEYVLLNEELRMEEIVKLLIEANAISVTLTSWCLSNIEDEVSNSICSKSFKVIDEAVETVLRYVATKVFEGRAKAEGDPLSRFYSITMKAITIAKLIIKNAIIIQEERVLCKILKPITISKKIVEKGYLVLLPLDQAVILSALGYVEPILMSIPMHAEGQVVAGN